jgi:hypothetical protein
MGKSIVVWNPWLAWMSLHETREFLSRKSLKITIFTPTFRQLMHSKA